MTNCPNRDLIKELQVLLDEAKFGSDSNDKFRVKSYKNAIEKISLLTTKIVRESDIPLTKGGKIYLKVKEFLEKGHIDKTREILATNENIIDIYRDLQKIAEIGPVKAKDLIENHGIRTIDELKTRQDLLNDKQKIGLKYWETDLLRIPRNEIKKHEKIYEAAIKITGSINDIKISINGSYRRGLKDSGDIDILVTHPQNNMSTFRVFVDKLISQSYLIDTLAYGDKKYMGYGKLFSPNSIPRRIDIIYCPPHEYPFAQLYFTGCGSFNVRMREYASSKGFRLNEKGLIDLKTNHLVNHQFMIEKDIFDFLGLSYVEPENRTESYTFHSLL